MHFKIFICIIICIIIKESRSQSYQVPGYPPVPEDSPVAYYFGNTYVGFRSPKLNWMEANVKCKSYGMVLTNFESKEEFEFQASFIARHLENPLEVWDSPWIGASDLFMEGNYAWLDSGKPFSSFYNSPPGQPDNHQNNEHCLHFAKHTEQTEYWVNDYVCDRKIKYVCKFSNRK